MGASKQRLGAGLVAAVLLASVCAACAPAKGSVETEAASESNPSASYAGTAAVDPWELWTADSALRGANIWQKRVDPEIDGTEFLGPGPVGPPYTQADLDALAALGANYVNISHPGLYTEDAPFQPDAEVIEHLDSLLAMIDDAGMWAVISFRTGPGRYETTFYAEELDGGFDDTVWDDTAAQDAWVAMWRYTAERYAGHPVVVGYDLMVEPNANDVVAGTWDPDEFYAEYGGGLADWNQLHPRIASAIRDVDGETPILIESMSYGSIEWLPFLELPDVPRVVAAVHQYEPQDWTHQEEPGGDRYPGTTDVDWNGEGDSFDRAWIRGLLTTVEEFETKHDVPIVINEFGVIRWRPGASTFLGDEMALFEERGWSHSYWLWGADWAPLAEIDEFDLAHGPSVDSHDDDPDSEFLAVLREHWAGLEHP